MNLSRRWFIGGAASFGALQGCRVLECPFARGGSPRLTFGVVSDIHIIAENTDRERQGNTRTLKRAFKWFDAQGADGVVIAGDMADAGLISQLQCVADAWNEVFPNGRSKLDGRPVEKLFIYGNHDSEGYNYNYRIFDQPSTELKADHIARVGLKKVWEEVFEEEYAPIYKKIVKGYSFIGTHWDSANGSDWNHGPNPAAFFAAHGKEIDPSLPFFYYQHPHPKDTCYGSWAWGHDDGHSTKVLSAYPNAIAFSGHSHYSLLDERTIWQGAFTSIGTGSLRYAGAPYDEYGALGGFENSGGDVKKRKGSPKRMKRVSVGAERNGLLVTVYDDRVVFTRRDFMWDVDLGPDWVLPLPNAEAKPFDFASRAKKYAVPQFPAGAQLKVEKAEDVYNLTIPCASQTFEGRVWEYVITITVQGSDATVLERHVLSPDYHLPLAKAQKTLTVPVPFIDLPKEGAFRFTVTPKNCFGKAGRAISSAI